MSELDLIAIFGPTEERTLDGAAHRPGLGAELVLSTGARYPFDRPLVIGRAGQDPPEPSHDMGAHRLEIPSRMLSRNHACVSPVGRRASVVDFGSTNGTLVISPERGAIVCRPGRLVLLEIGWRVELGGVLWLTIEPHAERSRVENPARKPVLQMGAGNPA